MMRLTIQDAAKVIGYLLKDSTLYINAINRNTPTSIGVFSPPESRMGNADTYGGDEFAPIKPLPINILVRWTDDSTICESKALEIYQALKESGQNFIVRQDDSQIKISHIKLLDLSPVWLGRDNENVCEFSIRADIFYYINE